jgi:hypothetical protein
LPLFDFASVDLPSEERCVIAEIGDIVIAVTGHCDEVNHCTGMLYP